MDSLHQLIRLCPNSSVQAARLALETTSGDVQRAAALLSAILQSSPVETVEYPEHWQRPVEGQQVIALDPGSAEYQAVVREFSATSAKLNLKVARIQDAKRWKWYFLRRKEITQSVGYQTEQWLFHGTPSHNITQILSEGLDLRLNQRAAFGRGLYFGKKSSVSMPYSGAGNMMLFCRVVTGRIGPAASNLVRPPLNSDSAGTGDLVVIFDNNQCYIEYLIEWDPIEIYAHNPPPGPDISAEEDRWNCRFTGVSIYGLGNTVQLAPNFFGHISGIPPSFF